MSRTACVAGAFWAQTVETDNCARRHKKVKRLIIQTPQEELEPAQALVFFRQKLLRLLQPDRSIPGVNCQQFPATVDFAVNILLAKAAFNCDRHVDADMAVTGMQVHVGSKVVG